MGALEGLQDLNPLCLYKMHLCYRIHGTGIFADIYHKNQPNVGKYSIHGSYGYIYIFTANNQGFIDVNLLPWKSKSTKQSGLLLFSWEGGMIHVKIFTFPLVITNGGKPF